MKISFMLILSWIIFPFTSFSSDWDNKHILSLNGSHGLYYYTSPNGAKFLGGTISYGYLVSSHISLKIQADLYLSSDETWKRGMVGPTFYFYSDKDKITKSFFLETMAGKEMEVYSSSFGDQKYSQTVWKIGLGKNFPILYELSYSPSLEIYGRVKNNLDGSGNAKGYENIKINLLRFELFL